MLSIEARDALMAAAEALAFVVDQPGRYDGTPSVRDYLEALAAAHERDPDRFRQAMIDLGVVWRPKPEAE